MVVHLPSGLLKYPLSRSDASLPKKLLQESAYARVTPLFTNCLEESSRKLNLRSKKRIRPNPVEHSREATSGIRLPVVARELLG